MGLRGPKPGWKASKAAVKRAAVNKARREKRAAAKLQAKAAPPEAVPTHALTVMEAAPADHAVVNEWQRDNPRFLSGDKLKRFANERGIPKSELATMSDEKIREQLRYVVARRYEDENAEA